MFGEDVQYMVIENKYTKENWDIGFGLQAVDGLVPSNYLIELVDEQVAGNLSYEELKNNLENYYESDKSCKSTIEADFSSMRIAEILSSDSFGLKPSVLLSYHRRLFSDIEGFEKPIGKFRQVNISKAESVLGGETVRYMDFNEIRDTLSWDFDEENEKSYQGFSEERVAHEVMKFISSIWQIHPFREGNTRTCAVFAIQYFRTFGFQIDNEPFKNHSKYFRDALVMANAPRNIRTDKYLKMFTENAVLNGKHELVIEIG